MQQDQARYALPPQLLDETPAPTQHSSPSDYSSSLPSLSNSNPSPTFLAAHAQLLPLPVSHLPKHFTSANDNAFDSSSPPSTHQPDIMSSERTSSQQQLPSARSAAPSLIRSKTSTQSIPSPSSSPSASQRWPSSSGHSPWSAARHVGTIGSGSASAKVSSTATFSSSPPQTRPKPTSVRHASFRMPVEEDDSPDTVNFPSSPNPSHHDPQQQPPSRPHSPPIAPPNASRSRSHSLAGNRPTGFAFSVPSSGGAFPNLGEGVWRGLAKGGSSRLASNDANGEESDGGEVVDERFPMEVRRGKGKGGLPSSGAGDLSNMSPFSRDLQEILRDPSHPSLLSSSHHLHLAPSTTHLPNTSRFRDEFGFGHGTLGGTNVTSFTPQANSYARRFERDDEGSLGLGGTGTSPERASHGLGGGITSGQASGTTSRRHSVSVVGRRAGGAGGDRYMPDSPERSMGLTFAGGLGWKSSTGFSNEASSGRGGAGFSDEDLAFSLGELSMGQQQGRPEPSSSFVNIAPSSASYQHPASLPIFAPENASSYQRGFDDARGIGMLGKSMGAGDGFASLRQQHQLQQRGDSAERDGEANSFLGVGRPVSKSRSASYSGVLKGRRWDGGRQVQEDDEDDEASDDEVALGGLEIEGEEDQVGRFALRADPGLGERAQSRETGFSNDQQPIFGLGLSGSPAPPEIVNARARQHSQPPPPVGNISNTPSRVLPPPALVPNSAPPTALSGYYPFTSSTAAAQNLPLQQQQHSRHLSQPQTGFRQPPPSGFYPPQQSHPGPGEWYSLQQGLPSPIGPQRPGGRQPSFDPQQGQQRGFGGPAPALMASANAFVPQGQQMRPPQGHPFYLPPQQLQQHQQQYPSFYPQPPQYNLQHHQRQLSSPTTSTTSPSGASSNLVASPLTPTTSVSPPSLTELGKGLPLSSVPLSTTLYIVEFKAGRTDLFYCPDATLSLVKGDLVIVEADRGKDLGKVVNDSITIEEVREFQEGQAELLRIQQMAGLAPGGGGAGKGKEITPKRIFSKAQPLDAQLLLLKMQDEAKALALCQQKVKQKALPMEVVDAEFQWDRRKLTFYFVAERRIDFRELVRELFRHFKTRIWMACLAGPATTESSAGIPPPPPLPSAPRQQQQPQQEPQA